MYFLLLTLFSEITEVRAIEGLNESENKCVKKDKKFIFRQSAPFRIPAEKYKHRQKETKPSCNATSSSMDLPTDPWDSAYFYYPNSSV